MALRAVLFDLWDTLIHDPAGVAEARVRLRAHRVHRALGGRHPRARLADALAALSDRIALLQREGRDLRQRERAQTVLAFLGQEAEAGPAQLERLSHAISSPVLDRPPCLVDGAAETLRALRGRGLCTALISNTGPSAGGPLRTALQRLGLGPLLDVLVLSDEEGLAKPHPEIFSRVLAALGVEPGEAIFVGDSPYHDVAGAQGVGMRAVLVGARSADGVRPDAVAPSVAGVLPLVDVLAP